MVRIGRLGDNDIVVDDLAVARHHAELRMSRPGHYEITDLASHNGTYVNGTRVARAVLADGDIVTVGHTTFRLARGELRRYTPAPPRPSGLLNRLTAITHRHRRQA